MTRELQNFHPADSIVIVFWHRCCFFLLYVVFFPVSLYLSISYALSLSSSTFSLPTSLPSTPPLSRLPLPIPRPPFPPPLLCRLLLRRGGFQRRWERAVRRAWRGRWRCQSTGSAQYQLTTRATCRASLSPPPPPSSAALTTSLICRPLSPGDRLSFAYCCCVLPAVLRVRGWAVAGRSLQTPPLLCIRCGCHRPPQRRPRPPTASVNFNIYAENWADHKAPRGGAREPARPPTPPGTFTRRNTQGPQRRRHSARSLGVRSATRKTQ